LSSQHDNWDLGGGLDGCLNRLRSLTVWKPKVEDQHIGPVLLEGLQPRLQRRLAAEGGFHRALPKVLLEETSVAGTVLNQKEVEGGARERIGNDMPELTQITHGLMQGIEGAVCEFI
jgi:hypothetical protein